MTPTTAQILPSSRPLRSDDLFFPAMALLILGIVGIGFSRSYFLAGMFRAPLPDLVVHVHAGLFMSWVLLLLVQNGLAATGNVKIHATLGLCGFALVPGMAVAALLTLADSIRRSDSGIPGELLLVGDLQEISLFVCLTVWGLLARRNAASHKRLMIFGTLGMLGPAIDRFPFEHTVLFTLGLKLALPALIVAYDLWSRGRIHRSTGIAYALMIGATAAVLPAAKLSVVHGLVTWIMRA